MCDRALDEVFSEGSHKPTGVDLLSAVQSQAVSNPTGSSAEFLKQTSVGLPPDIAVSQETLDAGAEFFVRNSTGILQSLMHFSLAGGFARWALRSCLNIEGANKNPFRVQSQNHESA